MQRWRHILLACAVTSAVTADVSIAQPATTSPPATVVLELFTSQGCSSCPAADALFARYVERPEIVALSFSVDYWDYLGWKDTLANPKFSKRQRYYAKARGDGQVYTPQVVVNGQGHANGADAAGIDARLAAVSSGQPAMWVPITIRRDGAHLVVEAGSAAASGEVGQYTLWLAPISRKVDVMIRKGENAGKTLSYVNVVRDAAAIGMWSGTPVQVRLDPQSFGQADADAVAVVLQRGMSGPIIGGAMLAMK